MTLENVLFYNSNNPPFYVKIEERGFEVKIKGYSYFQYKNYLVYYLNPFFNSRECGIIKNVRVD